MTPAVARQRLAQIASDRNSFISHIMAVRDGLLALGIGADEIEEGGAELALSLPRNLFGGDLSGLNKQLSSFDRVFRVFSELATGSYQRTEVRDLSSSIPTFGFVFDHETLRHLAEAFKWAGECLSVVGELRATIEKLKSLKASPKTVKSAEDDTADVVKAQIAEQAKDQLKTAAELEQGRAHEVETGLKWALETILASVERGATIELRLGPPTQRSNEDGEASKEDNDFARLLALSSQLRFPAAAASPVVNLPPPEPPVSEPTPKRQS